MRLFYLDTFWTVVFDFLVWLAIHLGVVYVMVRFSSNHFNPQSWLFMPRFWERGGQLYEKALKIKKWKKFLPDGARLTPKNGFPKMRLQEKSATYLKLFAQESCRSELTHWIIIIFSPLFFIWNKAWVGVFMIFFALAENTPLILAQRYNRIRLMKVLSRDSPKIREPEDD